MIPTIAIARTFASFWIWPDRFESYLVAHLWRPVLSWLWLVSSKSVIPVMTFSSSWHENRYLSDVRLVIRRALMRCHLMVPDVALCLKLPRVPYIMWANSKTLCVRACLRACLRVCVLAWSVAVRCEKYHFLMSRLNYFAFICTPANPFS